MKLCDKFPELLEKLPNEKTKELFGSIEILDPREDSLENLDPKNTILVGTNVSVASSFELFAQHHAQHLIQLNRKDFFFELMSSALMLKSPEAFVTGKNPFLLYDFHMDKTSNLNTQILNFNNSKQKPKILNTLEGLLAGNSKTARLIDRIMQIADEMMMNALYNAPTNKSGQHIFKDMNRTDYVEFYTKDRPAKIFLYYNDKKLLIGCDDPYGSLDYSKLISSLLSIYQSSRGSQVQSVTGSGIGYKLIVDNSMSLYVIVKKGVHTTVACSFELNIGFKTFDTIPKHFHFCDY